MLQFSELDFILVSATCYLLGCATSLVICFKYKIYLLERTSSFDDMRSLNHQHNIYPPTAPVLTAQPTAPNITEITLKQ